mmetsp:Transcript_4224/g.11145  ORF Transcript_4224/g.11145 Transcript_4224/m.11145 type:complete len:216 (+) Transcript_4224:32-679(+)
MVAAMVHAAAMPTLSPLKVGMPIRMAAEPTFGLTPEQETAYPTAKLMEMGGYGPETGGVIWDPLQFASAEAGASDVDGKLAWYRKAELKHGRISMAAIVGYLAAKNGLVFTGTLMKDGAGGGLKFADLVESNPFAEWANVPIEGTAARARSSSSPSPLGLSSPRSRPRSTASRSARSRSSRNGSRGCRRASRPPRRSQPSAPRAGCPSSRTAGSR